MISKIVGTAILKLAMVINSSKFVEKKFVKNNIVENQKKNPVGYNIHQRMSRYTFSKTSIFNAQSQFLEAALVRQADGEHKK